jgi:hypothetical protein
MRKSPRLLWLTLGGVGWLAACQSAGWQLPGFPDDAGELVRFQEQQQASLQRAVKRGGRSAGEAELAGRLERVERVQMELIESLSAGAAEPAQARQVGAELRDIDAQQAQAIGRLEQRLETELAQSAAPAVRELEAGFERDLIRLASADREQLERLARVEQRTEQLTERTHAAPVGRDWYWLFGLVSLGALPLVALWLWRGGRSRAQDQVDQLDQRLRELERPAQDPDLGAVRALGGAAPDSGRRSQEPRSELGLASAALAAAADAGGALPPEPLHGLGPDGGDARTPDAIHAAGAVEAEPGTEDLAPFEVPRRQAQFERRRPGLDPKHTATPPLGLFGADAAPDAAEAERATDGPGAEGSVPGTQAAAAEAEGSSSPQAGEPEAQTNERTEAPDPAARRKDFELELVRQLERRPSNRAGGAVDPFEDFAARRRAALQPSPANPRGEAGAAGTGDLLPSPSQIRRAGQGSAPQAPPPARASQPAAEQRPERAAGAAHTGPGDRPQEHSLRSMLLNAPWSSLSPLPAAEQRQGRFESELERAFRALEQERLAMESEERQAPRPRPPLEDEEFLASEDEDRAS